MERNDFNPSSFETSGDKSDDSKEKPKTKKKKSAEAVADTASENKKEAVADRTKELLDKFLGANKEEKAEKTPAATDESNEKAPETKEELTGEADQQESAGETTAEDDPGLEQLTPEEDAEITRTLVEEKLAELESGRDEQEAPEEAAGREAAIDMLERLRDEAGESERDTVEATVDAEDELPQEGTFEAVDIPEELDDEQTIPLNKSTRPITSSTGSGSGGSTPPPTARPSQPSVNGPLPPPGGGNFEPTSANRSMAPASEKTEYQPDYRVNPNRTYLLVGGIVGYLIGRRRGRIKTEKRLAVVQRKLEKQIEAKQQEIDEKTETVRKLARQNYEQTKLAGKTSERPASAQRVENPVPVFERSRPSREASSTAARQEKPSPERPESHLEKGIELTDADITRLSETITIGATNLRKIHEAKLITDGGLRRLVSEHLQGKDIRRGLAREFMTKELSYERDPRFRDIVPLEAKGQRPQIGSASDQPVGPPVALAQSAAVTALSSRPSGVRKPIPVKQKRSAVSTGLLTMLSFVALALAAYAVWLGLMR